MNRGLKMFMLLAVTVSFVMSADFNPVEALGPCQKDTERLCKDVTPGEGRILNCLKANEDKLSPECVANINKAKAKLKEAGTTIANWQKACHQDAQKLCKEVQYGQGRIMNCLQEHIDQVSPTCKGALQ
jgi:hypothetical protein